MKLMYTGIRMGKTTEAIRLANETGAYLVVRSRDEALRVSKLNPSPNRFPVTFQEILEQRMRGSFVRNIVIDNVDLFIQRIVGDLLIEGITISAEHWDNPNLPKEYLDKCRAELKKIK